MDPAPLTPDGISDIAKIISSGGSAATMIIVYVAFQLKAKVEKYLEGVNATLQGIHETLDILHRRIRRIEKHLKLDAELED